MVGTLGDLLKEASFEQFASVSPRMPRQLPGTLYTQPTLRGATLRILLILHDLIVLLVHPLPCSSEENKWAVTSVRPQDPSAHGIILEKLVRKG